MPLKNCFNVSALLHDHHTHLKYLENHINYNIEYFDIANNVVFSTYGHRKDIYLLNLPLECSAYVTILAFSFQKLNNIF